MCVYYMSGTVQVLYTWSLNPQNKQIKRSKSYIYFIGKETELCRDTKFISGQSCN